MLVDISNSRINSRRRPLAQRDMDMNLYHRGISSEAPALEAYHAPRTVTDTAPCKSDPYDSTANLGEEVGPPPSCPVVLWGLTVQTGPSAIHPRVA